MTLPTEGLLIANAAGKVVGSVAMKVGPVKTLTSIARGNVGWIIASVLVLAAIGYLETFDNDDVNKSLQGWEDAQRLLGSEQFLSAFEAVIPSDSEWDFTDRDAFDEFVRKLKSELDSVAAAFTHNAEALKATAEAFNAAIDQMIMLLIPVLLAVIASIAMQFYPPTAPIAQAIGIAGMTATVAIISLTYATVVSLMGTAVNAVGASDRHSFIGDSRPGWAAPGQDPNIKDIKINWVMDPAAYK